MKNAKIEKLKRDILGDFLTLCCCCGSKHNCHSGWKNLKIGSFVWSGANEARRAEVAKCSKLFCIGDPLYYPDTLGKSGYLHNSSFLSLNFRAKNRIFFPKIFIHYAVDFGWMLVEQQFVVSNAAAEDWGAIQFSAMLNVQTDTYKHLGLIITLPLLLQRQHNSGHHSAVAIRAQLPFAFHVYFLRLALCLSLSQSLVFEFR